jgi:hypothetical protein
LNLASGFHTFLGYAQVTIYWKYLDRAKLKVITVNLYFH